MRTARASAAWCAAAGVVFAMAAVPAGRQVRQATGATDSQQAPPTGTGLIVGQVVDGSNGTPIGGSIVALTLPGGVLAPPLPIGPAPSGRGAAASGLPAQPISQRVMTDGSGQFMFHDLPKGSFTLTATSPGYMSGSYGQRRPNGAGLPLTLDDGEHLPDATVRMWKYAVISGTLTDELGEPLVGIAVNLLRRTTVNGQRRIVPGSTDRTDDRGAYRLSSLTPGDYLVFVPSTTTSLPISTVDDYWTALQAPQGQPSRGGPAAVPPWQALIRALATSSAPMPTGIGHRLGSSQVQSTDGLGRAAPPPGSDGRLLIYPMTFYPDVGSPAQAQTITVASGEERSGIDFSMKLTATVRVSGTLTGPDGPAPNMGVHLQPAFADNWTSENGADVSSTATDATGSFTLLGVPPGQYVVKALRQVPSVLYMNGGVVTSPPPLQTPLTLWASAPLNVGETDVDNFGLVLREGVHISGRIVFDGSAAPPAGAQRQRITVTLTALEGPPLLAPPAMVSANGQFTSGGYVPGRYLLTANGPAGPWALRGIVVGGQDVSRTPLSLDSDVSDVVVTFTDRPTRLAGSVTLDSPKDPLPTVVIFPADTSAWIDAGMPSRMARTVRVGSSKMFSVTGLPAGDYLVAAVPDEVSPDVQDPTAVQAIARVAARITLTEGQQTTVDLRPVVIR